MNNDLKCDNNLNFEKLANLTEGYTIGYLLQFIDRAVFYAYRNGMKPLNLDRIESVKPIPTERLKKTILYVFTFQITIIQHLPMMCIWNL